MTSPEERPDEQGTDLLAKLFDIRSFTGALFLIFGVIVTVVGLTASAEDIAKSAGLNLALILGPVMLAAGVIFIGWLLLKPPQLLHSHEVTEEDLPEQLRHQGLEAVPEHPGDPGTDPPPAPRHRPRGH